MSSVESTDIREYLSNLVGTQKLIEWQKKFHNQDLHYAGFVCKVENQYDDGYDASYSGCIYLNGESTGLYVIGESPYGYAKDFWKTVDNNFKFYKHEDSTIEVV